MQQALGDDRSVGAMWLGRNPLTGLSGLQLRGKLTKTRLSPVESQSPYGLSGLQPLLGGALLFFLLDEVAIPLRG